MVNQITFSANDIPRMEQIVKYQISYTNEEDVGQELARIYQKGKLLSYIACSDGIVVIIRVNINE